MQQIGHRSRSAAARLPLEPDQATSCKPSNSRSDRLRPVSYNGAVPSKKQPLLPSLALTLAPSHPPAHRSRQKKALGSAQRKWVLHKSGLIKLGALMAALAFLAGGLQARGLIETGLAEARNGTLAGLAGAGLGIKAIDISGQSITSAKQIAEALAVRADIPIVSYNVADARARLLALPAISEAHVRKVYPNHLAVTVVEKRPVARWRVNGADFLIDAAGEKLGSDTRTSGPLPLVIGAGAADNANALLNALAGYPALEHQLAAVSRIADRRWDLLYDTGLRVQLPEHGLNKALADLNSYQQNDALLERDLTLIDMRVPGTVAVRLAVRETANSGADNGAGKSN